MCFVHNHNVSLTQTVLTDLDSDHLPVIISLAENIQSQPKVPRLITGQTDWEKFRQELDKNVVIPTSYNSTSDINKAVQILTNIICESTKRSVIHKNRRNDRTNYNLVPNDILAIIREKNRIRKQWQRTRNPTDKKILNKLTSIIRVKLDEHRILKYNEFLNEISPGDQSLWVETKRILNQPSLIPQLQTEDGQIATTDKEKCEFLADQLERTYTTQNITDLNTTIEVNEFLADNNDHTTAPVAFTTPKEIAGIIKNFKRRKAPGRDIIPNIVLKELSPKTIAYLTSIYNACLRYSYFPKAWKAADIIVFPKPGKPKHDPKNFRPISLLPGLSKILEKVVHKRLLDFLHKGGFLPQHQFGFRKGYSTIHQLQRVTELIVNGFETKMYSAAISLDVASAFDSVWHKGLLYKIKKGAPHYIYSLLNSFLGERTFRVRINGIYSSERTVSSGIPQGSILSPLLFIVFCHDMPTSDNCMLATYADDTLLITKNHDLNIAITELQKSLTETANWFKKWNFRLNARKTNAKIFSLKKIETSKNGTIDNVEIPWLDKSSPLKYLGVELDTRLTYKHHINRRLNIAHQRLSQLYPLINRRTPLKIECSKLLYKSLIRPLLTYACPVWYGISMGVKQRLESFQNKILRIALNAPWFVRNNQIRRELGIEQLSEHIDQLSKTHHLKLQNHPAARIHHLGEVTSNRRLKPRLFHDFHQ